MKHSIDNGIKAQQRMNEMVKGEQFQLKREEKRQNVLCREMAIGKAVVGCFGDVQSSSGLN